MHINTACCTSHACCQQTAYISGRGQIDHEMELVLAAEGSAPDTALGPQQESNEALLLNLPGKSLDVSFWVHQKRKFRNRGGIEAALQALKNLQEDGMGELQSKKMKGTVKVCLSFGNILVAVTLCAYTECTLGFSLPQDPHS